MIVHDRDMNNTNGNRQRSVSLSENSYYDNQKLKYNINPKPIGSGSFATVYHGVDQFGKNVAIKRIKITSVNDKMLEKFLFELHIGTVLDNKNIVKCIETFKTERHWYIVSEYCDAGTFIDIINLVKKKHDTIDKESTAKIYLNQLKDAIKYLRDIDVIHRDLKPQNILLKTIDDNGKQIVIVKLADFGFARYFNKNTQQDNGDDNMVTTICGSPIYMAPEMLINGKYNMKADLWSFGVIMYETMFGFCPFNYPKNISQLCEKIKNQNILYPIEYSNECIDLIKSLLTNEPEKRMTWNDFFEHPWFNNVDGHADKNVFEKNQINDVDENVFEMDSINDKKNQMDDVDENVFEMDLINDDMNDNNIKSMDVEQETIPNISHKMIFNKQKYINEICARETPINKQHTLQFQQKSSCIEIPKSKHKDYVMVEHNDIDLDEINKQYSSQISFTGSVINIIGTSMNVFRAGIPRSI
jgi:serine/threonine protein kinase